MRTRGTAGAVPLAAFQGLYRDGGAIDGVGLGVGTGAVAGSGGPENRPAMSLTVWLTTSLKLTTSLLYLPPTAALKPRPAVGVDGLDTEVRSQPFQCGSGAASNDPALEAGPIEPLMVPGTSPWKSLWIPTSALPMP